MNINISAADAALPWRQGLAGGGAASGVNGLLLGAQFHSSDFLLLVIWKGGIFRDQVLILFVVLEANGKWTHQSSVLHARSPGHSGGGFPANRVIFHSLTGR